MVGFFIDSFHLFLQITQKYLTFALAMKETVYNFGLNLDWEMLSRLRLLDRFDSAWETLESKDAMQLQELKTIATIRSIGSSTRIEGSQMSNEEVENLLKNIKISKLESRDAQEVAGYYEALEIIFDSFNEIQIRENDIKSLHNILLKHSTKDLWHKGDYKQMTNAVEATMSDGSKKIIFQTTEAGIPTQDAMRSLINWYNAENQVHPLIKCAAFVYEFVSIHPFQDGNGRMSRLLTNLLLLKNGYHWIQYVSLEHEIESRKVEYYKVLRMCQAQRPNEDISLWVEFFLDCLRSIQTLLNDKISRHPKLS